MKTCVYASYMTFRHMKSAQMHSYRNAIRLAKNKLVWWHSRRSYGEAACSHSAGVRTAKPSGKGIWSLPGRVRHSWSDLAPHPCNRTSGLPRWLGGQESACLCRRRGFDPWVRKTPWRGKRQPTPVFLPAKSHGQRSLAGDSLRGRNSLTQLGSWRATTAKTTHFSFGFPLPSPGI